MWKHDYFSFVDSSENLYQSELLFFILDEIGYVVNDGLNFCRQMQSETVNYPPPVVLKHYLVEDG